MGGGEHRVLLDPSRERRHARTCSARLWDESDVRNLSLMCERVHEHGALAGVELGFSGANHTGLRDAPRRPRRLPDPERHASYATRATRWTSDEIRELQGFYVAAAERARRPASTSSLVYGAETVSIPQQFLMPYFNRRTDEYGGSFENRARFFRETLELVREAVGDDCAIARPLLASTRSATDDAEASGSRRTASRSSSRSTLVDLWDLQVGPAEPTGATDAALLAVRRRELPEAVGRAGPAAHAQADRRRRPVHQPGHDGRGDPSRPARHHRRGPAVDRRPVPAERRSRRAGSTRSASASAATSASRASSRAAPIICTQNATAGEEYRRGWHPRAFTRAAQRRERRAGRRRRAGWHGVRDGARQARHAPRAPGRRRGGAGRDHALGPAAARAGRVGPRRRLPPDPDRQAAQRRVHPGTRAVRRRGRRVRRRHRRRRDRLALGDRRAERLHARRRSRARTPTPPHA